MISVMDKGLESKVIAKNSNYRLLRGYVKDQKLYHILIIDITKKPETLSLKTIILATPPKDQHVCIVDRLSTEDHHKASKLIEQYI
jgi:hypothetical protein